jgi:hypothetical protein
MATPRAASTSQNLPLCDPALRTRLLTRLITVLDHNSLRIG